MSEPPRKRVFLKPGVITKFWEPSHDSFIFMLPRDCMFVSRCMVLRQEGHHADLERASTTLGAVPFKNPAI